MWSKIEREGEKEMRKRKRESDASNERRGEEERDPGKKSEPYSTPMIV